MSSGSLASRVVTSLLALGKLVLQILKLLQVSIGVDHKTL